MCAGNVLKPHITTTQNNILGLTVISRCLVIIKMKRTCLAKDCLKRYTEKGRGKERKGSF